MSQRVSLAQLPAQLLDAARAALGAVHGEALVAAALAGDPRCAAAENPWVAGAGKAVAAMAAGARRAVGGRARFGVLIGKDEPGAAAAMACLPAPAVRLAGHPLPDERGARATDDLLAFAGGLAADDELVFLLSGGASALL